MKNLKASAQEVLRRIERNRGAIRRYSVKRIGLFGSTARGKARKNSDLDFLVAFERETFDNYMGLKFYLEDLFHKKVDLVMTGALKKRLEGAILSEVKYVQGF